MFDVCIESIMSKMLSRREGDALVCRMSLNSDRCVGNMGVAVLLSQQHTISYRLRHAVTLLYDSSLLVFTSDPAIMKRKRRCDVDDVAV